MADFTFITDETLRSQVEAAHKADVEELNKSVDSKITEAVDGLKVKNQELLDEKKKVQASLKAFDGLDVTKAKEALAFFESNPDAKLNKEELVQKYTSQLRSDHEAKVNELVGTLEETRGQANTFKTLYETKMTDDQLTQAAIAAKVRPDAIAAILLQGRGVFTLSKEDGMLEARDADGKLKKTEDGKVLTPQIWFDNLKKAQPFFWPGSEGAGFGGSGGGSDGDMTAALNRAAASGNMVEYRRLREVQKKSGVKK